MTFDARRTQTEPRSGTLKFAIITLAVVVGAFLTALLFPWPSANEQASVRIQSIKESSYSPLRDGAFRKNKSAQAYFKALAAFDPDAANVARDLLAASQDRPVDQQADLLFEHAGDLLRDQAKDIANAPTSHFDGILNLTRDRLNSAARRNNKWCRGARYAEMADKEFTDPAAFSAQFDALKPALQDYSFDVMTLLLQAAEDGRANPVRRSKLSPRDEMALQGVAVSLMSDPEFRPLLMSAQSGADADASLRKTNVCRIAATAVTAVKTLPQDTKGRLFAELTRNVADGGTNLGTFSGFSGF